jgi:uncharacterized membrane protein
MTLLHIIAGFIALSAGAVALCSLKGGKLHRKSGTIAYAMVVISGSGALMAALQMAAEPIHRMNVLAVAASERRTSVRADEEVSPVDAFNSRPTTYPGVKR